jgi:hypothetical protein
MMALSWAGARTKVGGGWDVESIGGSQGNQEDGDLENCLKN